MSTVLKEYMQTPTAEKSITPSTSSQTIDVIEYATALVSAINTQTKTATANGTVTPTSGYYLTSVTVAVPTYDGTVV